METASLLRLADGRKLAFQEWGEPGGQPVVSIHATPGSRLERYPDEQAIAERNIRLITFDRPGYGLSDAQPGRTLLDCAGDVVRLADHLGLEAFSLMGMSGGGPFVLATAWATSGRVLSAAVSCGLAPLDRDDAFVGMSEGNARELALARSDPAKLMPRSEGELDTGHGQAP
ncbi:alpha/beta fold hydrolase [Amycolatopsis sp. H20-H5]|uniref:alpha/beta fold hydrolase n=1 Tax=Amycolatopsis sp. H20-H5 TaxID=3046309 RepID=UPI002DBB1BD0|nr:alpha/beta hydrolase [Amycolatopsis sp. H20-H5]MEC3974377.1 alpha/beta hydrolase [Amycolatopsis sp. H20-H5]